MRQRALARVSNKLPLFASCIVLEAFSLPAQGFGERAQHGLQPSRLLCLSLSLEIAQTHVYWVSDAISSAVPFSSCLQSFPASVSFLMSQFFSSDGPSIGFSAPASALPMYSQGWFPLGLTGLIFLLSKWFSRIFSSTTVQNISFFFKHLFFNWRIIALQNFVVFCQTSTWISHKYTYIPSLLKLPPISHPILPL